MKYTEHIQLDKLPQHIGVIMDGNGRWAKKFGFLRSIGHINGVKSVRRLVEYCAELGVPYLTLYAFSTENWSRPQDEVSGLMKLLVKTLSKELETFQKNDIRLMAIGRLDDLPEDVRKMLEHFIEQTKNNTRLTLTIALSYGARAEIVRATKLIAEKVKNNLISIENIDDVVLNAHLYTQDLPDVDLMIRTSGEQRVSNFMLWQMAYAELYFTEKLWPDMKKNDFAQAIYEYQKRERRFGKTSEQINSK